MNVISTRRCLCTLNEKEADMKRMIKSCAILLCLTRTAFGFQLDDGSVVPDDHVADHYVGLISGQVTSDYLELVDLDPNSYPSLDVDNSYVVQGIHSVVEVDWTNSFLPFNAPGADFMITEAGSDEGPMIAVKVNGEWSGFLWVPGSNSVTDTDIYFKYDISDMGIADGAVIQAVRVGNPLDYTQQTNDDFGHLMFPTHDSVNNYIGYKVSHTDADPMFVAALQYPPYTPSCTCTVIMVQ